VKHEAGEDEAALGDLDPTGQVETVVQAWFFPHDGLDVDNE